MAFTQGTAGGSLGKQTKEWGRGRVRTGQRGEVVTAEFLNRLYGNRRDVFVFHDLFIPHRGNKSGDGNMDHAVLRGRDLVLIDTKMWKPGFYFTIAGKSFRFAGGRLSRVKHAEKRTMVLAEERFRLALDGKVRVHGLVIVHPAGPGALSVGFLRMPGAKVLRMDASPRWIANHLPSSNPPDPSVMVSLGKLTQRPKSRR